MAKSKNGGWVLVADGEKALFLVKMMAMRPILTSE